MQSVFHDIFVCFLGGGCAITKFLVSFATPRFEAYA